MSDRLSDGAAAGPLDGMTIIEGGSFVAIPSGAMTLALLGADVIRFDPIGGAGDYRRAPTTDDGTSIYWASLNKGKRSIAIDVRSDEGRELVSQLITAPGPDRGLFLTNTVASGRLSDTELRSHRPDLITLQLTGYPNGAPAVDYTVNWEVGFPLITGSDARVPTIHALPAWDLLAGLYATTTLLAAERRRARTGAGDAISISLSDVALAVTDNLGYFAELQLNGSGREQSGDFVYGTFGAPFATADGGQIMVVALTERQWTDLVDVADASQVIAALEAHVGVTFTDEHARYRYRTLIREAIAPWFTNRTTRQVVDTLADTRVLSSVLQSFDECFHSSLVQGNPLFELTTHPTLRSLFSAGLPAHFERATERPAPVSPVLGADTEWVLAEYLGMSAHHIGDLHDRRVVASASPSRYAR
ncbi:MAG: CoA transferase [Nitriliruptoraceae bacterium]